MNVPQFSVGAEDLAFTQPDVTNLICSYGFGVDSGRIVRIHAMKFTMKSSPSKTLGWQLTFGELTSPTTGTIYSGKAIDAKDDSLTPSGHLAQLTAVNGTNPQVPYGIHTFSYVGEIWEVPIPPVARFGPQLILSPTRYVGFMADPVYGQSGAVDVEVLWSE